VHISTYVTEWETHLRCHLGSTHKRKTLDYDELIKKLDLKYRNTPEFKETIVELIQRPSLLSNAIKEKYGYKCMISHIPTPS